MSENRPGRPEDEPAVSDRKVVVRAKDLNKIYRLYDRPIDRLWEKFRPGKKMHREVHAVRDLSVEVESGSALGIVGSNGAGKSTMLKILAGTTLPTSGLFEVQGRVASLLELGTGFYPGFTGLQNIFLAGIVMGYSKKEMTEKVDEIIEFSELGGFIHQPIRTYSSGMIMRLGFSVATAVDPDVLIIDEILAVGDLHFQKRCVDRIMSFRAAGKTILFCSHSMYHVEEICDHAIWIQDGNVRMYGKSQQVCRTYEQFERRRRTNHEGRLSDEFYEEVQSPQFAISDPDSDELGAEADTPEPTEESEELKFSSDLPQVIDVRLLQARQDEPALIKDMESDKKVPGAHVLDDLAVEIDYDIPQDLKGIVIGCAMYGGDQEMKSGIATHMSGFDPPSSRGHYTIRLDLPKMRLLHGEYKLVGYVADERGLHIYHSNSMTGRFQIQQRTKYLGVALLEHEWSARRRGRSTATVPGEAPSQAGAVGGAANDDG